MNFERWKFAIFFVTTWVVFSLIYSKFLSNSFVYSNPTFDPAYSNFKLEILKGLCSSYEEVGKVSLNESYYRDWETDRKSTRLNSSHEIPSRMPSSA